LAHGRPGELIRGRFTPESGCFSPIFDLSLGIGTDYRMELSLVEGSARMEPGYPGGIRISPRSETAPEGPKSLREGRFWQVLAAKYLITLPFFAVQPRPGNGAVQIFRPAPRP
jgi:hypothetical protein